MKAMPVVEVVEVGAEPLFVGMTLLNLRLVYYFANPYRLETAPGAG